MRVEGLGLAGVGATGFQTYRTMLLRMNSSDAPAGNASLYEV